MYVEDDAPGNEGAISNGWSLTVTTITPVNQLADLAASMVTLNNTVILGNNITNIWTVTNNGPDAAPAFVTNTLPSGSVFVTNFLPPGATSSQSGQTNFCSLGNLIAGASVLVTNVVEAISTNAQTNVITVGSSVLDGNLVNNTAFVVTTVTAPPAELIVAPIAVAPNPAVVNSNLVYMVSVTNIGPSNAFNVIGSFALAGLQLVSAVPFPSQGASCSLSNGFVICSLGTISVGNYAEVTITAFPLSTGLVTNVWSVTTSSTNSNIASNTVSTVVMAIYPTPVITIGQPVLQAQGSPPLNGAINSNQTNTVLIPLINVGSGATTNLVATLQSTNGIRPITASNLNTYGAIAPGHSVSQFYTFVGTGNPGSTLTAVWSLQDGTNSLGTVTYPFILPVTTSFSNSALITIPDFGEATPYPSAISVTGLTNFLLNKVTATLNGFAHSWPHDVVAVLVGPAGQELVLMEHTGGPYAVSNLVFTFDDSATQSLASNILSSGTYLPTEYAPFDTLPNLAPVPAANTSLAAAFNGASPDGIWSLYVYDDTQGNDGLIANGWSLGLTAVNTVSPAALLVVSATASPNPAVGGDYVNYQITVSNSGPNVATAVFLTDTIPSGTALAPSPVTVSPGSYTTSGRTVSCNLGTISNGAFAVVTIKVIAGARGTITNTAIATTASTDLYLAGSTNLTTCQVLGYEQPYLFATNMPGGLLQLTLDGYAGQNYAIQTSSNLVSWTTVLTNTGTFIFTDTRTNAPRRFYRAIQLAQ